MTKYFIKKEDGEYEEVKDFTKEQLDGIVGESKWLNERIKREREKFADYDNLKQQVETLGTEKTLLGEQIDELEAKAKDIDSLKDRIHEANQRADKSEVMRKLNISDDLAEFVSGNDYDEMFKRAEKLSKSVTSGVEIKKSEKAEPVENEFKKLRDELLGNAD